MGLPKRHRPGGYVRTPAPGVDLPAAFLDELKSIDRRLHIVWEPWRCERDMVMNAYTGALNDPRFSISLQPGFGSQELWGWVLKTSKDAPIPENRWHIYELVDTHGWCHVAPIMSSHPKYLALLARRLHLQAKFICKYGTRAYARDLGEQQEKELEAHRNSVQDLQMATMEENSWLVRSAIDNMSRGIVAPTNPTKETISSFAGQTNRSRIIRPLDDDDAGLISYNKIN